MYATIPLHRNLHLLVFDPQTLEGYRRFKARLRHCASNEKLSRKRFA
jgi:hypothetical protein